MLFKKYQFLWGKISVCSFIVNELSTPSAVYFPHDELYEYKYRKNCVENLTKVMVKDYFPFKEYFTFREIHLSVTVKINITLVSVRQYEATGSCLLTYLCTNTGNRQSGFVQRQKYCWGEVSTWGLCWLSSNLTARTKIVPRKRFYIAFWLLWCWSFHIYQTDMRVVSIFSTNSWQETQTKMQNYLFYINTFILMASFSF